MLVMFIMSLVTEALRMSWKNVCRKLFLTMYKKELLVKVGKRLLQQPRLDRVRAARMLALAGAQAENNELTAA